LVADAHAAEQGAVARAEALVDVDAELHAREQRTLARHGPSPGWLEGARRGVGLPSA
jgi:hypothetical protein